MGKSAWHLSGGTATAILRRHQIPAKTPPQARMRSPTIRASPQEIPRKSQQAHKHGWALTLLLPWGEGVPPWTCADLWGISCGRAGGGCCWDLVPSKNSSSRSPGTGGVGGRGVTRPFRVLAGTVPSSTRPDSDSSRRPAQSGNKIIVIGALAGQFARRLA